MRVSVLVPKIAARGRHVIISWRVRQVNEGLGKKSFHRNVRKERKVNSFQ
jgi:hypothetical protein